MRIGWNFGTAALGAVGTITLGVATYIVTVNTPGFVKEQWSIDVTQGGPALSRLIKSALSGTPQCEADAKPKLAYEQREYDRWAEKSDDCMHPWTPSEDHWEDPDRRKANCQLESDTLAKHKVRLDAAKAAMKNCSAPT